jgi:hypothetical protein
MPLTPNPTEYVLFNIFSFHLWKSDLGQIRDLIPGNGSYINQI